MTSKLKPNERAVLDALVWAHRKLSTRQVAKVANMSWSTAHYNLQKLHKRKYVRHQKIGNKTVWWIRD
jgi:predicted transcriptional regulator